MKNQKQKIDPNLLLLKFIISVIVAALLSAITAGFLCLTEPNFINAVGIIFFIFIFILPFYMLFIGYPIALLVEQIILLYRAVKNIEYKKNVLCNLWVLGFSWFSELFYLGFINEVRFSSHWSNQLYNYQLHAPIFTDSYPSLGIVGIICIVGLCVLWKKSVNEMPPLVTVLCIAACYLGSLFVLVWTIQVFNYAWITNWFFILYPSILFFLIVIRTIVIAVKEYTPDANRRYKMDHTPILKHLNQFLMQSKRWPVMGFVLMLPLLALMVAILTLFGQAPNSLIKAFTETSDWTFSQRKSPPNIGNNEHYLCTVAAQGHPNLVHPIRKGIRHGHEVTVNRQLLIANAFEQILEEKTPTFHRVLRKFYDTYGFPIARLITTKWAADCIWLLMKPLEWFFLIVLYLCDVHPEDRIAIQYTGKRKSDFLS